MAESLLLVSAFTLLVLWSILKLSRVGHRDLRMPPGPPTLPVLGNAHQIPSVGLFKKFHEWAREYGPIFTLKFGPANVVVLCDREAIHKLLVEKGNIYSDRPPSYVGNLLTKGDHVALHQMTPEWREKRKVISHNFSPMQLDQKHFKVQEAEATVLMNNLLENPEGFFNHIRRYTASVITSLTYGQRAPTFDSFWAYGVYDVMTKWTASMEPGANPPVDEFPFLQYTPPALAFWKRRALDAGRTMDSTWATARRLVEERRATGERRACVIDTLLDQYDAKGWPMSQHAFTNLMGELIEGGADTTSAQLLTLILAFAIYPDVQRKAQNQIDEVCGASRSPEWSDFSQLPYINCIVKEGCRWRPVAVTALPHRSRETTEYKGMLIPKGTTLFIPTWAIHHMDTIYDDPEVFNPDRYANHEKLANDYAGSSDWQTRDKHSRNTANFQRSETNLLRRAHHYNYGAGRRICPGIHLAERNMWRIAAKLLWAFEFSEPIDPKTGQVKHLDPHAYNPGILQAPLPFEVQIKARSARHVDKIREELDGALQFLKQFD